MWVAKGWMDQGSVVYFSSIRARGAFTSAALLVLDKKKS